MKTALLSLLLTLIVGIAGLYVFEEHQKFIAQTQTSIASIKNEIHSTQSGVVELQKQISELSQKDDWRLTETAHLLRLASLQLQISRDIPSAIQLLQAADNQLKIIQDPALTAVRQAITNEKTKLESVKLPDIEGLWLTISAFITQIPELPTRGLRTTEISETAKEKINPENNMQNVEASTCTITAAENSDNESQPNWRTELHNTWQELKDIIKIQRHTKPIEPILPLSEQLLAKEHLTLLLDQVRWAILHANTTIYKQSLKETHEWLDQHFEAMDERIKKMKESLKALEQIDLRPTLPDMGQALQLLQSQR